MSTLLKRLRVWACFMVTAMVGIMRLHVPLAWGAQNSNEQFNFGETIYSVHWTLFDQFGANRQLMITKIHLLHNIVWISHGYIFRVVLSPESMIDCSQANPIMICDLMPAGWWSDVRMINHWWEHVKSYLINDGLPLIFAKLHLGSL